MTDSKTYKVKAAVFKAYELLSQRLTGKSLETPGNTYQTSDGFVWELTTLFNWWQVASGVDVPTAI